LGFNVFGILKLPGVQKYFREVSTWRLLVKDTEGDLFHKKLFPTAMKHE